jgi:hypothetical protein
MSGLGLDMSEKCNWNLVRMPNKSIWDLAAENFG